MSRPRLLVHGPSLLALGSVGSLVGLVLTSVVAARVMGPDTFSTYAAMVAVIGVLGTGVAGAMEQETARRVAGVPDGTATLAQLPLVVAGAAVAVGQAAALLPLGWQHELFGGRRLEAVVLIVAGVLTIHAGGLARGLLAGTGRRGLLGLSIALHGLLPVLLGVGLSAAGLDPFVSFGVGTVVGGGAPALVALPALRTVAARSRRDGASDLHHLAGLIAGNLFLTANMVVIPAVLRVHVEQLSAGVVASLQIVVSLSRLSTLLVANVVVMVVAAEARQARSHVVAMATVAAAAFGVLAVLGTTVLAPLLLPLVFGGGYDVGFGQAALASLSVVFLNPAYILTGIAVARRRGRLIAWAWASGAAVLAVVAGWQGEVDQLFVLIGIAVSALVPTVILALGVGVPGRARRTRG